MDVYTSLGDEFSICLCFSLQNIGVEPRGLFFTCLIFWLLDRFYIFLGILLFPRIQAINSEYSVLPLFVIHCLKLQWSEVSLVWCSTHTFQKNAVTHWNFFFFPDHSFSYQRWLICRNTLIILNLQHKQLLLLGSVY